MPTTADVSDFTARARVRDAAIALFGERGYEGVSIRDVAAAADVSPGLVQHHFGTKERLREACDERAFAVVRETKRSGLKPGAASDPLFLAAAYQDAIPAVRYIARALVDGSPGASRLFDEMVAMTEDFIQQEPFTVQTEDLRAYATAVTSQALGALVLHEHVSRALGADVFTLPGYLRLAGGTLDVYSSALIAPDMAASMREGLVGLGHHNDSRPPSRSSATST